MLKKLLHQLSFEPPPQIIKMFKLCSGLGGFVRCIFFSKSKSINVGQMDNKSEHVGCPDPAIPLYLFSWLLLSLAAMLLLLLLVSYFSCVSWLYFEFPGFPGFILRSRHNNFGYIILYFLYTGH